MEKTCIFPTYEELTNRINELKKRSKIGEFDKTKGFKTTLPDYARFKNLLYQAELKYNAKAVIDDEESFNVGLIFKTKYITYWVHFEGIEAKQAEDAVYNSIKSYMNSFGVDEG